MGELNWSAQAFDSVCLASQSLPGLQGLACLLSHCPCGWWGLPNFVNVFLFLFTFCLFFFWDCFPLKPIRYSWCSPGSSWTLWTPSCLILQGTWITGVHPQATLVSICLDEIDLLVDILWVQHNDVVGLSKLLKRLNRTKTDPFQPPMSSDRGLSEALSQHQLFLGHPQEGLWTSATVISWVSSLLCAPPQSAEKILCYCGVLRVL